MGQPVLCDVCYVDLPIDRMVAGVARDSDWAYWTLASLDEPLTVEQNDCLVDSVIKSKYARRALLRVPATPLTDGQWSRLKEACDEDD